MTSISSAKTLSFGIKAVQSFISQLQKKWPSNRLARRRKKPPNLRNNLRNFAMPGAVRPHPEIIESEMSGVFNWILDGLRRLLAQNGFSQCDAIKTMLETYKRESDSVAMFIDDEGYTRSTKDWTRLNELYPKYRTYCSDNGSRAVSSKNLIKRLEGLGFETEKKSTGKVIFIER